MYSIYLTEEAAAAAERFNQVRYGIVNILWFILVILGFKVIFTFKTYLLSATLTHLAKVKKNLFMLGIVFIVILLMWVFNQLYGL